MPSVAKDTAAPLFRGLVDDVDDHLTTGENVEKGPVKGHHSVGSHEG